MKTLRMLVVFITFLVGMVMGAGQTSIVEVAYTGMPKSLPIGSDPGTLLNWVLSNRQWDLNGDGPLATTTAIKLVFSGGSESFTTLYLRVSSFREFEEIVSSKSKELLLRLKKRKDITPETDVELVAYHDYVDFNLRRGVTGVELRKGLGPLSSITANSFENAVITFKQAVVRIDKLEKFEVYVDCDYEYSYSWPAKLAKPASTFPPEITDQNYIVLSAWYSSAVYRARFRITAGGITSEYTQHGSVLRPPSVKILSESLIEVTMTSGSDTTVETSTDMETWTVLEELPWSLGVDKQRVRIYSPPSQVRFFRAKSK